MKKLLDNTPLTSIITVAITVVGGVVAIWYPENIETFLKYSAAVGAGGGGLGVLGIARSAMNKG